MNAWKKHSGIAILVAVVGGVGAWLWLDPEARHAGLALLGLDAGATEGADFWCPMHPEIRRQTPGTCPI